MLLENYRVLKYLYLASELIESIQKLFNNYDTKIEQNKYNSNCFAINGRRANKCTLHQRNLYQNCTKSIIL